MKARLRLGLRLLQRLLVCILFIKVPIIVHGRGALHLLGRVVVLAPVYLMISIPLINLLLLQLQICQHTWDMIDAYIESINTREVLTYHSVSSGDPFFPGSSQK